MDNDLDLESRFGRMGPFTKAFGKMIWQVVKVDSSILMEMSISVTGPMTKLRAMVSTTM